MAEAMAAAAAADDGGEGSGDDGGKDSDGSGGGGDGDEATRATMDGEGRVGVARAAPGVCPSGRGSSHTPRGSECGAAA